MAPQPANQPGQSGTSITSDAWGTVQPNALTRDPIAYLKAHGINVPANLSPRVIDDLMRIVSLVWVNGQIIAREQFHIEPDDEGLLFGRGLWESTRTFDHVPWLWPLHIERLLRTAALLGIDIAPERLPNTEEVTHFARTLAGCDVVIRLNVSAGWPAMKRPGLVWMTAMLIPQPMASARLKTVQTPVNKDEPYLIWKTFQYAGRLKAGQIANQAGFDSALLVDPEGNILEMCHANVFVRLPDGWATPPANTGLLPGTVRQHILANAPIPIRERTIPLAHLADASEVFVTNSKVGIVPVTQVDERAFPIGEETRSLMGWLQPGTKGS